MSKIQNATFCVLAGAGAITIAYKIYEQSTRIMTKLRSTNINPTSSQPPRRYNLHTSSLQANHTTTIPNTLQDYLCNCTTPNNILQQEFDDYDTAFRAAQYRPGLALDNQLGLSETYASTLDDISLQTPDSDNGTTALQAARHIPRLTLDNQLALSEAVPCAPILTTVNLPVLSDETDFLRLDAPVIGFPPTYESNTSRGASQFSRLPSGIPVHPSMFVVGYEDHGEGLLTPPPQMMETNQTTNQEYIATPGFDPVDYDIYDTTVQTEDRSTQSQEAYSPYTDTIPRVSELIIERPDERSSAAIVSITSSRHCPKVSEYRAQLPRDLSRLSIKVERGNWHPGDTYTSIGRVLNNVQNPSSVREISLEVPEYRDHGLRRTSYHTLLEKFYGNLTKLTLKGNAISIEDCVTILWKCPRIVEFEIDSLQPVDSALRRDDWQQGCLTPPFLRSLTIRSDVDLGAFNGHLKINKLDILSIIFGEQAASRFNPYEVELPWDSNSVSIQEIADEAN